MPAIFPPVEIDGERYIDGGVVNNVPIRRAIDAGATRIVVLLVRPPVYTPAHAQAARSRPCSTPCSSPSTPASPGTWPSSPTGWRSSSAVGSDEAAPRLRRLLDDRGAHRPGSRGGLRGGPALRARDGPRQRPIAGGPPTPADRTPVRDERPAADAEPVPTPGRRRAPTCPRAVGRPADRHRRPSPNRGRSDAPSGPARRRSRSGRGRCPGRPRRRRPPRCVPSTVPGRITTPVPSQLPLPIRTGTSLRPLGVDDLVGVLVAVVLVGDVDVGTGVDVVADLDLEVTDDVAAPADHAPVADAHHRVGDHLLAGHHARPRCSRRVRPGCRARCGSSARRRGLREGRRGSFPRRRRRTGAGTSPGPMAPWRAIQLHPAWTSARWPDGRRGPMPRRRLGGADVERSGSARRLRCRVRGWTRRRSDLTPRRIPELADIAATVSDSDGRRTRRATGPHRGDPRPRPSVELEDGPGRPTVDGRDRSALGRAGLRHRVGPLRARPTRLSGRSGRPPGGDHRDHRRLAGPRSRRRHRQADPPARRRPVRPASPSSPPPRCARSSPRPVPGSAGGRRDGRDDPGRRPARWTRWWWPRPSTGSTPPGPAPRSPGSSGPEDGWRSSGTSGTSPTRWSPSWSGSASGTPASPTRSGRTSGRSSTERAVRTGRADQLPLRPAARPDRLRRAGRNPELRPGPARGPSARPCSPRWPSSPSTLDEPIALPYITDLFCAPVRS